MPNSTILLTIESSIQSCLDDVSTRHRDGTILSPLVPHLSESARVSPGGAICWVYVDNREDLMVLMRLAPVWTKEASEGSGTIDYHAMVGDRPFRLIASDAALPGTCRVEERDVEVAAVPAHTVKRLVVVCEGAGEIDLTAVPIPEAPTRAIERDEDTPF